MIDCDPNSLMQAAACMKCIPRGMQREVMVYLLCQWANKTPTVCVWWAGDGNIAPPYVSFSSFADAVAYATANFTPPAQQPSAVFGDPNAYWNSDGSAPYVIIYTGTGVTWSYTIGTVGNVTAESGGGFADANATLAKVQLSPFLPVGFCV